MISVEELLFFALSVFCLIQKIGCVSDTITVTQLIKDGETIISSGGSFEMGFFSPSNSKNRYVGIWYKNIPIQTVVWVANREVPLNNTAGVLQVIKPGHLVLRNDTNNIIWSSNSSWSVQNPVAQLLDSGNLVVKDANDHLGNFLWQSFNYPSDTFLPGMKLGWNFVTGLEVYLSSWKNYEDPAPGEYTYNYDPSGYPQKFVKSGSVIEFRTGPWNGIGFSGVPILRKNPIFSYRVVFNEMELYFTYELLGSVVTRFTLSQSGVGQRWMWDDQARSWKLYLSIPADRCDSYAICGAYGSCDIGNSAICGCLDKFEPKNPEEWAKGDSSNGCTRNVQLDCHSGDGFLKYSGYKLPDTRNSSFSKNISLEECETICLKNCTCTAYSSLDITNGGSGCLLWFGDLIDMKVMPEVGQDIYVRMPSSESGSLHGPDGKKGLILAIGLSLPLGMVLIGSLSLILYIWRRKNKLQKQKNSEMARDINDKKYTSERHKKDLELPLFDLSRIIKATNNFSSDNKLGEGGYGPVYKGVLEEGQEVAVKRLSETSRQGLDEFKNELICIAKLQHRNHVKLLGCCIEGMEKILIYEYMPNKSLDLFIFDPIRSKLLDWPRRFHIIQGIARGILYLHQDSRLRIIHRDLKASNVLLDVDMNPKISDFGTARSFGGNETGANTSRVVGTHGYLSPEYAVDGLFSVKSDVFSFGVVLLEIISGKRNRGFYHHDHHHNLLGHAWMLYKEERALEIVDCHLLGSPFSSLEVLRAIHVGLLCVQKCPDDRPSMSSVVFMLGNEGLLPEAKQPGFFTERYVLNSENSSNTNASSSSKGEITITLVEPR
ncbi:hypothetical protein ACH5RR_037762 [Cinchona calisaya]|uniref:Receptor-like serine/threonine-protein kinase n=1 Tax=Cinchona calisaya TaxID=153742 RepID=A0ABD2YCM4_9GENT